LLLACCFATAAMVNENRWRLLQAPRLPDRLSNIAGRLLQMVLIVIAVVAAYVAFGQWRAKKDWDKLRNQLFSSRAEIHAGYRQLYNTLHYDGKFLTDYGMFLAEDSADCPKAVAVLEEAKKYVITRVAIETLAQAYKKTGNYQKAIENYQWLCNYLPNKFGTKLELLTLYVAVNDSVNARKTAHTILTMPVKIPSREVDRIKNETTGILQRLH
jgi:tetratricopeptide (TPR) repeat protein